MWIRRQARVASQRQLSEMYDQQHRLVLALKTQEALRVSNRIAAALAVMQLERRYDRLPTLATIPE